MWHRKGEDEGIDYLANFSFKKEECAPYNSQPYPLASGGKRQSVILVQAHQITFVCSWQGKLISKETAMHKY
jgi:hypothetical protein